jgi:hypothetical protein
MAALLKCNYDNSVDKPSYGGGLFKTVIRSGYRSIRIHGRRIAIAFWPKAGGPAAPTEAT